MVVLRLVPDKDIFNIREEEKEEDEDALETNDREFGYDLCQ